MTQALSGAAIAAVIAVCWLLGRPRPKLLRSTDTSGVAALNRQQMERLVETPTGGDARMPDPGDWALAATESLAGFAASSANCWPRDARERGQLLIQLDAQFRHGGEARRQAMALCAAWGHRATLPLLRRGLRDTDRDVIALAAAAIDRFRGAAAPAAQPAARPPRNVSRTR